MLCKFMTIKDSISYNRLFFTLKIFFQPNSLFLYIKGRYLAIAKLLTSKSVKGIVPVCTEIPLLIKQADTAVPLFDTLAIHVEVGGQFALG